MPKLIEKIFMLRRHQLIRWGRLSGLTTIGISIVCIVIALFGEYFVATRLKSTIESTRNMDRKIIQSVERIDDLREYSRKSQIRFEQFEELQFGLFRITSILFGSAGLFALSCGLLSLRARELAIELNQAEQDASSNGG